MARARGVGMRPEGNVELRLNDEPVPLPEDCYVLLTDAKACAPRILVTVPVSCDSPNPHQALNVPMPVYLTGRDTLSAWVDGEFYGVFRACAGVAVDPVEAIELEQRWHERGASRRGRR